MPRVTQPEKSRIELWTQGVSDSWPHASQLHWNKVKAVTEILFRATSHHSVGQGQGTKASPSIIPPLGKLSILQYKEREGTPKEHFNCHRIQTIPTEGPIVIRKHTNSQPPFLQHFQMEGIFVLSGNRIVFSSKNELITDAACANNDNLLCSKVTSLPPLTDDALEITG